MILMFYGDLKFFQLLLVAIWRILFLETFHHHINLFLVLIAMLKEVTTSKSRVYKVVLAQSSFILVVVVINLKRCSHAGYQFNHFIQALELVGKDVWESILGEAHAIETSIHEEN